MTEPPIDPTRNNALIWWNITLDNVLTEIDQLAYYCQQNNDQKHLEDLRLSLNQKGLAIAEAGKRLEHLNATESLKLSSSYNFNSKYLEHEKVSYFSYLGHFLLFN